MGKLYSIVFVIKEIYKLVFQLVEVSYVPLLSANAYKKLYLIQVCKVVNEITKDKIQNEREKVKELVKNYKGKLKKEVSLELNGKVVSKVQTPRRILIALRTGFESTLNDLEQKV